MNLQITLSAITAFIISAGGAVGIVAASGNTLNNTVWILSAIVGLISAAKDVRSLLKLPPVEASADLPKPPTTPKLPLLLVFFALFGLLLFTASCAKLQPGADPVVVNTERFLTSAQGTFLFTLQVDNQDRGFWRTKAPAFHEYCETLRRPTPYPATSTNLLPQYRVALLSLNDLKNDYKAGRASSNAVLTTLNVLVGLEQQATAWLTIVTNRQTLNP